MKLITVSIGGNDVTACVRAAAIRSPASAPRSQTVEENVTEIAARLRAAAGKARIVGTTYPDVILGQWVGRDAEPGARRLSVVAFKELINPALAHGYEAAGGRLVDVTAKSGAYGSLDELVPLPGRASSVPAAGRPVCELTYYCEFRDIHARTNGYRLIAEAGREYAAAAMTADVYDLPQEHKDFRDTIRQIAAERIAPRAAEIDATDEYPWDIRGLLAEQDVLALPFDEEYGGTGTGTLMLQVAVEEIAPRIGGVRADPDGPGARHAADPALRLPRAQGALPAALRHGRVVARVLPVRARRGLGRRRRCARAPSATATSG